LASEFIFAHDAPLCEGILRGQDQVIEGLTRLEALTLNLNSLQQSLPAKFILEFELDEKILNPAGKLKAEIELSISNWNPSDSASNSKLIKDVVAFERKSAKYLAAIELWLGRFRATSFAAVRSNPQLLVPNRIYKVKTDRGEDIQVRFSPKVLDDFFWEDKDQVMVEAAEHAVEAIARGYQPPGGYGAGIATLSAAIGGRTVYKTQIIGTAIGAHRVYGLTTNGVIGFVTHEASSDHDASFLRRATSRAIKAYDSLGW
jgi:hypothetical protein